MIIETLVGVEMFKMMKSSDDNEIKRRILIGKWLYINGFLSADFPARERYIPGHVRENLDD
jgi:hypothetical protein